MQYLISLAFLFLAGPTPTAYRQGPKIETQLEVPGMRYHVKNAPLRGWVYEENPLRNVKSTVSLLARITISKVEDEKRLVEIFRATPIVQNDPNWRCRTWVADVLARISQDGRAVGTADLDWMKIEAFARDYVAKKADHGRYGPGTDMSKDKPTWDMIEGREAVP
ncbi:Uncharacterized protein BP5553_10115 [Venustampulla echinocandica]|uniref:Uncharacterized protein n=1 Tax=Venustampulla echinocandica TaxID=2656787 RepID=A0A370TAF7_9HELO|nr:Uncharacterized protein BP5553_10115 [Venustampulla echinocandica]RDL30770.1 Uncharacterized protein BP5553_10115 [Venustampulla echinocandica]